MRDLTRREVIVAGAAVTFGPSVFLRRARYDGLESFDFAYYSDSHISLERNRKECRVMLDELVGRFTPELAINGGDVVDYGWAGEYDQHAQLLAGFAFATHHIPGNHDVRWSPLGLKIFQERVGPPFSSFDHKGVHFALLDSTVPLSHWGHYESAMLRWLEADLKKVGRGVPVVIATHHWVGREPAMIDNERALMEVIEPYNVQLILTGHGHKDLLWEWNGLLCTMNKGLYQGSYQRIQIDGDKGELTLSRRASEQPEVLTVLAERPLKPEKAKREVWSLGTIAVAKGRPVQTPSGATRYAWNGAPPLPVQKRSIPTDQLLAGDNVLVLSDDAERNQPFVVRVADPESPLQERWRRKLGGGVMSHLIVEGGRLYVSAMDGSVQALDPETGRPLWISKTGAYCHSSPRVSGDLVVVGSADGFVHAFDAATGKPRWKVQTQGPVYASAAFTKGVCAIASGDGSVYGLDEKTGAMRWRYTLPKTNTSFIQSPASTDGTRFFLGAWDNYLYALDAETGRLEWRSICCERTFAFSPAIGGPAVSDRRVVVPANGNILYCFDTATGKTIWEYSSPRDKVGYSGPRIVDGRIYIGCLGDNGEARCIELADGKEVWCANLGLVVYDSSPAVSDGFVSVGSVASVLSLIEQDSGKVAAQVRLPQGHVLASPAAHDGWLWAASLSDWVVGFRLKVR